MKIMNIVALNHYSCLRNEELLKDKITFKIYINPLLVAFITYTFSIHVFEVN